jgi:hypothetical protein
LRNTRPRLLLEGFARVGLPFVSLFVFIDLTPGPTSTSSFPDFQFPISSARSTGGRGCPASTSIPAAVHVISRFNQTVCKRKRTSMLRIWRSRVRSEIPRMAESETPIPSERLLLFSRTFQSSNFNCRRSCRTSIPLRCLDLSPLFATGSKNHCTCAWLG